MKLISSYPSVTKKYRVIYAYPIEISQLAFTGNEYS